MLNSQKYLAKIVTIVVWIFAGDLRSWMHWTFPRMRRGISFEL